MPQVLDGKPGGDLRPRRHAELAENALEVVLSGAWSNNELLRDLFVREALRDEGRDFTLASAQADV
jgi:hypothetical protein